MFTIADLLMTPNESLDWFWTLPKCKSPFISKDSLFSYHTSGNASSGATAGTALTGGGGAGYPNGTSTAGGSGVVILSYSSAKSITLADGATSSAGEQTDGFRKYIQIESTGTVSWT